MQTKQKIKTCVYCGQLADTKDHIPSKSLFSRGGKDIKNPIIVPSCLKCNQGFSLDEEYFRNFICGLALEHSFHAKQLFFSKIKKSIQRRPQIGYKALEQMKLVDLYTKSGLYIGKRTMIYVTENDWSRYFNVLDKYIKGLVFYEFKSTLPTEYRIKHSLIMGKEAILDILSGAEPFKWNIDNKDIFMYGLGFIQGTYKSTWITVFYKSVFFLSVVFTERDLAKFGI